MGLFFIPLTYFYGTQYHTMSKPFKLQLFTIILFSVTIAVIVYRYEQLLSRQKKEQKRHDTWTQATVRVRSYHARFYRYLINH